MAKTTSVGAERFANDVVEALAYRASNKPNVAISDGAAKLVTMPLHAVAAECLKMAGREVDPWANREEIVLNALDMGGQTPNVFYSEHEKLHYKLSAEAGGPANRPGDFPNILSGLANKFLDMVELDEDYSYSAISAVLPGGLKDFKPAPLISMGVVDELDEVDDAEQFHELGISEEMLGYLFLRRFGNKFGWTPVMIADDDLGAFAEGMIGLRQAWEVTQNRLVVGQYTSNPTLLDGSTLFADRTDVGSATNNNDRTSGGAPSDAEWEAMEILYADIGGIGTDRRVRGSLNTLFCPTGTVSHEAHRYFAPLNIVGEIKQAATTDNVGIWRGKVNIVPESELRAASATTWYGLRSPTKISTATVVRGYFRGYGQQGKRESWKNPNNKCFYVSLEGRIAVAVKNWRYAVRNNGS